MKTDSGIVYEISILDDTDFKIISTNYTYGI
jgi:hypothetical protein